MDITSIVCMLVPTSKMTGCSPKASSSSSTFVSPANKTVEPVNSSLRVAIALHSAEPLGCHPVTCGGIETTFRPLLALGLTVRHLLSYLYCHPASSVLNGAVAHACKSSSIYELRLRAVCVTLSCLHAVSLLVVCA